MLLSMINRIYKPELYEGLTEQGDSAPVDSASPPVDSASPPVDSSTTEDVPMPESSTPVETTNTTTETNEADKDTSSKSAQESILTTSNFNMVIMFIFLYIVAYTILGVFYKHDGNITMSFLIDMMFTVIVAGVFYVLYYSLDSNQQQKLLNEKWKETKDYVNDEYSIAYQVIFIILFYAFIYLFRIPMRSGSKPAVIFVIETIAWLLLLFIVIIIIS